MQWQWLIGPAVGGIIGYITNDIAVRMMFRPHRELRLFGRRVPFTPGLIPKERPRLAASIRDVLDEELLSREVLEGALLGGEMLEKIGAAADAVMASLLAEERTPRMLLEGAFGEEAFASFEAQAKRAAGIFIMEKILESGIENIAAEAVVAEAKKRVAGSAAAILGVFLDKKRAAAMRDKLSQIIREMLAAHGPEAVNGMIGAAAADSLDMPIGTLVREHGEKLGDTRALLMERYAALIRKGLPAALKALDLGGIVEDKINSLDMAEVEALIMQVMKKELRAIVWLGALLGAVMGLANAVAGLAF
ncbi:MAG: DUF445 family protein [Firmicutes bacterium]|nr:DUF445 family protein [Bacillota bacterium]